MSPQGTKGVRHIFIPLRQRHKVVATSPFKSYGLKGGGKRKEGASPLTSHYVIPTKRKRVEGSPELEDVLTWGFLTSFEMTGGGMGVPHPSASRAVCFSPPARATGGSVTAGALTMRPLLSAHSKQHLCCFDTVRSSFPPKGKAERRRTFSGKCHAEEGALPLTP